MEKKIKARLNYENYFTLQKKEEKSVEREISISNLLKENS
jgi:hypothetical protein